MKVEKIPVDKIIIPERVREDMGNLEVLKESISKYGLLNPVQLDGDYNLISGHRRLQATKELGLSLIDACILKGLSKMERFEIEMQENIIRKNLSEAEMIRSEQIKIKLRKRPFYLMIWEWLKKFILSVITYFKK